MSTRPTRHQLRRHARRFRRDGYQPMIVLNSGDQLPDTAATEIGRAIWRYRSELAPIALAGLTALTAAGIHHSDRRSWVWFALATIGTTAALAVPSPAWARRAWSLLDRPADRAYAAIVAANA